ncbi:hypothetical protein B0G52_13061 [Cohnella sp. SGD-V74]|uniref:hypothetical protein n=1 Tax=unclassified Cohnella TaxID=2636738 RepID=UPI000D4D35F7|nr:MULTISPECIES: hypothetical protein [unclassified Cohnella]PRX59851.1 hypothetical protein B0G52_13061 [Cohnella sp. SGD-V74]
MSIDARSIKWLAIICLLAGTARMGMTPTALIWGTDSLPELVCGYIACILMSIGSIVFYTVQAKESGALGLISVLSITLGNIMTAAFVFSTFAVTDPSQLSGEAPMVMASSLISLAALTGGTVLFAFVTYRAKVFPRWIVGLLILMLLFMFVPIAEYKFFALFWGLTYVGTGYCIWRGKLRQADS